MEEVTLTTSVEISHKLKLAKVCQCSGVQADRPTNMCGAVRVGVDGLSRRFSIVIKSVVMIISGFSFQNQSTFAKKMFLRFINSMFCIFFEEHK